MSGPILPPLTVTEIDGSPVGRPITEIRVSNGDLTVSGNIATIDTSGSSVTPGGSDTEVQYNDGGSFAGDAGFIMNNAGGGSGTSIRVGDVIVGGSAYALHSAALNGSLLISPEGTGVVTITPNDGAGGTITDIQVNVFGSTATADSEIFFKNLSAATASVKFDGSTGSISLETSDGSIVKLNGGTNTNIDLTPNGTGQNRLISETVVVGNGTAHAFISSNDAYDLVLETKGGSDSPTIRLVHGTNGGITLTPAGTGAVSIGGNYNLPTAVTGSNDYVLTAQTDGSTAWAEAGGGGASTLGALTDVSLDITNFTDSLLIQTNSDGSAPTTGTLNAATGNLGIGKDTFSALTSGDDNICIGNNTGLNITTGYSNVLIGVDAGKEIASSEYNVAIGYGALMTNDGGYSNVAIGRQALKLNDGGTENVAVGSWAMTDNDSGERNTAVGRNAIRKNTSGDYNTGLGYKSLYYAEGSHNIGIGIDAGGTITTGSNNVVIGGVDVASATADDQLSISSGDAGVAWITGDSAGSCYQGDNASTWSTTSDERLKTNIVDSPKGLEEIKLLKVRNFNYIEKATPITEDIEDGEGEIEERIIGYDGENKYNLDPEPLRTGFIAQELEVILPEAVKENLHGHKTVDIDPVIYSLINAVQELSAKVETLEAMIE